LELLPGWAGKIIPERVALQKLCLIVTLFQYLNFSIYFFEGIKFDFSTFFFGLQSLYKWLKKKIL
jgi:hypothetical protein